MAIATLSIDLEAKLAKLEEGMGRAARVTEQNAQQIQRSFDGLKNAGALLGGVLTGAFAAFSVGQLVSFVRRTEDGVDALNDLKDATGSSIENLSALEDVAARGGTSFDTMSTALLKFNKVLTEAKPDNEVGRVIKSIGLDAEALRAVDPAEALRQVSVALSNFSDDGGKARAVQELFGKSTKDVAKFLKDLADQGELVAKVTTAQAEETKKFNDQLDSLSKNSTDAARSIVGNFLPALNSVLASYIKLGGLKGTILAVFGQDDLSQSENQAKAAAAAVSLASDRLASLSEEFSRDPGNKALGVIVERQRAKVDALRASAALASDALKGLINKDDPQVLDGGTNLFAGSKPKLVVPEKADKAAKEKKDSVSEAIRQLAQYVEQLDKQIDKEEELTEVQKALNALNKAGKEGEIPQVRELVLNLAKKKDALEAEAEIVKELARFEKERADAQRAQDNDIDAFSGRSLDQKKRELGERLETRLQAGEVFSPEELERIVNGIAGISTQLQTTGSDIEEFTKNAAANIEDTLGASINDALRGNFKNIGDLWKNMLINMASQALSANLTKALLGTASKDGIAGGLVGSFLSFLKSEKGNAFGSTGVIPFANGGVFDSPQLFKFANGSGFSDGVLGEAGPEAVMPLKRGSDGKLGISSSGGGGTVVNFIGDTVVGHNVSHGEVQEAVRAGNARTEQRIRRLMKNGNI